MNRLLRTRQVQVISALVEGMSIRSTCRLTGVAKGTVLKLLVAVGGVCNAYQRQTLRQLSCTRIQCDEIWSFCYAKAKNVPKGKQRTFGYGDVWTWVALDADTKLVPCWLVGDRSRQTAEQFMKDLASRLAHRVQLSTDGYRGYLDAVEDAFGSDIDYAMIIKEFGIEPHPESTRYSPFYCTGVHKTRIMGHPDKAKVSTSYAERQNLSMRLGMRRMTRLTNGFSKKVDNLRAAVALYFMHYNFCRIHQSLRVTPAMEAGVTKKLWSVEDLVGLLDTTILRAT